MDAGPAIGNIRLAVTYDGLRRLVTFEAVALFLSGANWDSLKANGAAEAVPGEPVLTADQAAMWVARSRLGVGP